MAGRLFYPIFKAFDSSANLLVGGKLYTYSPGTTTAKATYSDAAETTPHANPIILDSLGEKEIFLDGATKLVLKDSTDVTIWTKDSVLPGDGYVVGDTATVDTIAALRLISGSAGSSAQPFGYYAAGDGGGGPVRVWKTGAPGTYTDNGGSTIVPTGGDGSGAWVWAWSGPVNAKWLGATGDGVTDDYTALNRIFNSTSLNTWGKVFFPAGAYRTTQQIAPTVNFSSVIFEGGGDDGSLGPNYTKTHIFYDGAVDATKATIRFTAGPSAGWTQLQWENLHFTANQKAGAAFVIEGTTGATYANQQAFDHCDFSFGTKFGLLIGDPAGLVDLDSHKVVLTNSRAYGSPINVYANGQNMFGLHFDKFSGLNDPSGGATGYTVNHIRIGKGGNVTCNDCYFGPLKPETTVINPITGIAVADADVYAIDTAVSVHISGGHSEESRVLRVRIAAECYNTVDIDNFTVNDARDDDGKGRNLDWDAGAAAYSIYNEGHLKISHSQFGDGTTGAGGYRRIYNNSYLNISNGYHPFFLGIRGLVIHGSSSRVVVDEMNATYPINANHNLSYWQSSSALLDGIAVWAGGGTATLSRGITNADIGHNVATVTTTVASGSNGSGFLHDFRLPAPGRCTLIVSGYAATWNGLSVYRSSNLSSVIPDGNIESVHNSVTKRFIAALQLTVNNASNERRAYNFIGMPSGFTGVYDYDVIAIVPGWWTIPQVSALLKNGIPENDNNRHHVHFGTAYPTVGENWDAGDIVFNRAASSGNPSGWICTNRTETAVKAGAVAGAVNIDVDSTTGITTSHTIGIQLDSGAWHWSTVSVVVDADTVTIASGIPAGQAAAIGKYVMALRWNVMSNLP